MMAQAILNERNFQILLQVRYFQFAFRIFTQLHYKAKRRIFVRQKLIHCSLLLFGSWCKTTSDELCCSRCNELEPPRDIFSQQGKLVLLKANNGLLKNNFYNMEGKVRGVV